MKKLRFAMLLAASASFMFVATARAEPPRLPHSSTKDAIEGWCNEKGGTFYEWSDGSYHCALPGGYTVDCYEKNCSVHVTHFNPILNGILATQQQLLTKLDDVQEGQTKIGAQIVAAQDLLVKQVSGLQAACTSPDLVPLPLNGVSGPAGYCRRSADGTKLQVLVYNQGGAPAGGSATRVTFTTRQGPLTIDTATSAIAGFGGSEVVEVPIPAACTGSVAGNCDFSIGLDATSLVLESNKVNNTVAGTCGPFIY